MSSVLAGQSLNAFIAASVQALGPMVTIPGGTFQMGSTKGFEDEQPLHETTVSSFRMGVRPVTNEEYVQFIASLGDRRVALIGGPAGRERVLALGASEDEVRATVNDLTLARLILPGPGNALTQGGLRAFAGAAGRIEEIERSLVAVRLGIPDLFEDYAGPRQPVVLVTWFEALAYASLHGGRLPTEWEWEYAARVTPAHRELREGTTAERLPSDPREDLALLQNQTKRSKKEIRAMVRDALDCLNFLEASALREYATPSGRLTKEEAHYAAAGTADVDDPRYPALPNGLRHMTGNVKEWMQNFYGPYPKDRVRDPIGPTEGPARVMRGSSWGARDPRFLRAAARLWAYPAARNFHFGFRVVAAP